MQPAWLSKNLANNTVKCLACNHFCQIATNKTGLCKVRKNIAGELQLLVYGYSIAQNIDPIEKKPLFHFYPGQEILSIGTVGCNMRCAFCQNWQISQCVQEEPDNSLGYKLMPADIIKLAQSNKLKMIAYTYNEPSIFFEYAYDTAKLAHDNNIKNVFVSNGYLSKQAIDKIKNYLDAINIDLKAFSNKFYQQECGANLQPVLDTIKYIAKTKIWLEITTLIIPGKNDSEAELSQIADFIAKISPTIPWHLSAFHPTYKLKDIKATTANTLINAYNIGKTAGLKHVYIGNTHVAESQNTYCSNCNKLLIARDQIDINTNYYQNGKCPNCFYTLEGHF